MLITSISHTQWNIQNYRIYLFVSILSGIRILKLLIFFLSQGCQPEVRLDFKNGVADSSGKWTYVNNQGVVIKNGEATFNGDSRLLIPRFTNVDFGKTFVIRLRYKEQEKLKFNESQALVNNGDCGDFGSIQIFTKRNSIGYVVKTTKEPSHVSLQIHKPVSIKKNNTVIEYMLPLFILYENFMLMSFLLYLSTKSGKMWNM